jgi:hypothetical protein
MRECSVIKEKVFKLVSKTILTLHISCRIYQLAVTDRSSFVNRNKVQNAEKSRHVWGITARHEMMLQHNRYY